MSETRDNGGQAFPRAGFSSPRWWGEPTDGMSLRDWFAGQAVPWAGINAWSDDATIDENAKVAATWAYALADAMLKARGEA